MKVLTAFKEDVTESGRAGTLFEDAASFSWERSLSWWWTLPRYQRCSEAPDVLELSAFQMYVCVYLVNNELQLNIYFFSLSKYLKPFFRCFVAMMEKGIKKTTIPY